MALQKIENILNKSKCITFDFDETLSYYEYSYSVYDAGSLIAFNTTVDFFKKHQSDKEIHIVTFRSLHTKEQVIDFCKAHGLKPKSIVCTNNSSKIPHIKKLNSDIHFEDSMHVLLDIKNNNLKTIPIFVDIKNNVLQIINKEYNHSNNKKRIKI